MNILIFLSTPQKTVNEQNFCCPMDFLRAGHAQFESAIAIPQLEGSTSAIAIPQLFKAMLIRNRNSAIPQFF